MRNNYLMCDTEHIKVILLGDSKPCREMRSHFENLETESLVPLKNEVALHTQNLIQNQKDTKIHKQS